MSLAYLNLVQRAGMPPSAEMSDPRAVTFLKEHGYGPIRTCAVAADVAGDEVLGSIYTALGRRIHEQSRYGDTTVYAEALEEVGLSGALAEAVTSDALDDVIHASHLEAYDDVGLDVGAPVLRTLDRGFFGPVLTSVPQGESAGRLWDGFVLMTTTEGFFEVKRSRGNHRPSTATWSQLGAATAAEPLLD